MVLFLHLSQRDFRTRCAKVGDRTLDRRPKLEVQFLTGEYVVLVLKGVCQVYSTCDRVEAVVVQPGGRFDLDDDLS